MYNSKFKNLLILQCRCCLGKYIAGDLFSLPYIAIRIALEYSSVFLWITISHSLNMTLSYTIIFPSLRIVDRDLRIRIWEAPQ